MEGGSEALLLTTSGGESPLWKEEASAEEQKQNAEGGTVRASRDAELADGTLEQQVNHCQAAQQAQEQQQEILLPAEGSAGQEGTAGGPEK